MKRYFSIISILLFIAFACCLFGCERQMTPLLPPEPPTPPPLVILYPKSAVGYFTECVFETVDMYITGVEAFNSKTTSEVILKISGAHGNGCVSGNHSLAYYRVDDRTITVWATKHVATGEVLSGGCACPYIVVDIGIAMYVGELEPGEYKVVSQSGEQLLTFHTDNLGNMTAHDCKPNSWALPQWVPPDVDPEDCP